MAPREASGTFPDQFLTYDYEPSVPIGAPPVHEPFPPVPTGMETDNLPPEDGGNTTNGAGDNGAGNGNGSDVLRNAMAAASQVDPLSIDPTANQQVADTSMDVSNSNNTEITNIANFANHSLLRPRLADVSTGNHSQQTLQCLQSEQCRIQDVVQAQPQG